MATGTNDVGALAAVPALTGRFLYGARGGGYWALTFAGSRATIPPYLREFKEVIRFQSPFRAPPIVTISINNFQADMFDPGDASRNSAPFPKLRYSIDAVDITVSSFTLSIQCWDATKIYFIGGNWIAFSQDFVGGSSSSEASISNASEAIY